MLNRRTLLQSLPIVGMAATATPAEAATEYAIDRVNRLAKELSVAMDDWMLDLSCDDVPARWRAVVYPSKNVGNSSVWFEDLGA